MMLVDNHFQLHTNYFSEDEFNCVRDFIEIENPTLVSAEKNGKAQGMDIWENLWYNKVQGKNGKQEKGVHEDV